MKYTLANADVRQRYLEAVRDAPDGFEVVIRPKKRTLDQNALLHALCQDIARQATFSGRKLDYQQWKVLFVSGHAKATGLGSDVVCGLEGEYVNIRESTADMSKARMNSLMEYIFAWAAYNGIRLPG